MSTRRIDWLRGAIAIGEKLDTDANSHPLNYIPRNSGVGTNLEAWPHMTQTQANKLWREIGLDGEPVHMGSNMYGAVADVAPRLAFHWLRHRNVRDQRVPTEAQLAALARDNLHGRIVLMDNAVSFNAEGGLDNGQHRCWATLVAGHPVKLLVCINKPASARHVTDQTVRRMAQCVIKSLGNTPLSSRQLAVIRGGMFGWASPQQLTIDELMAFVGEHLKAFEWLFWYFDRNIPRVTTGPVQYAVFRAYKTLGRSAHDRLAQFADYMVNRSFERCGIGRFSHGRDGAVAAFRDWMLASSPARKKATPRLMYSMTALVIMAFLDHQVVDCSQIARDAAKLGEDLFPEPAPLSAGEEPFSVTELLRTRMGELGIDPKLLELSDEE